MERICQEYTPYSAIDFQKDIQRCLSCTKSECDNCLTEEKQREYYAERFGSQEAYREWYRMYYHHVRKKRKKRKHVSWDDICEAYRLHPNETK